MEKKKSRSTFNFARIERKWQKKWEEKKAFRVSENSKKEKFYVLEMYPYPSASGLHMGHAFNYTIGDIYARFKRMKGFNVLYPMGYDSFGLPAENAAIKARSHPKKFTEAAIKNYIKQQKNLGLSYDWSRMVETHKPDYYRWNQFFFLKFLENKLAYRKKAPVNWCGKCNTVLANEQVHNGKCWRHKDTEVEIKHLEQWFLKTTEYAEELLKDIEKLEWPERIKIMQRNWIGKSFGYEIDFAINGKKWPIFTTHPETLFGATFMVVSAQHPRLDELVTPAQRKEVDAFLKRVKSTSEKDSDVLEKEGAFTGSYAINPATNEKIPVWTGNFVVADYGSGMVMAVPAHDQRDFEFAHKYGLKVKQVVGCPPEYDWSKGAYTEDGGMVNSGEFNGLPSKEAVEEVGEKFGKRTMNFKLRDWLISRQRFWGTPIPVIHCAKCGIVPVPEKDLPVKLPDGIKFMSEKNPLVEYEKFVKVKCPSCGGGAERETDTMDTFVDSSWYFLRYLDSENDEKAFEKAKAKSWMPVDQYIGGAEHAVMHLIYARFFTKALRDLGFCDVDEPFPKLFNQGMLHGEDGAVMSKSGGNAVLPETVSERYGNDTARFFLVSIASPDKDIVWNEAGVEGSLNFIERVMKFFGKVKKGKSSERVEHRVNKAIRDISKDIEEMKYNFAVIKLRGLFESLEDEMSVKNLESCVKLLSPFCPHIAEELWEKLGNKSLVSLASWPKHDEKKINERFDRAEEAVEKTVSDILNVLRIVGQGEKVYVYVLPQEREFYEAGEIGKRVGKVVEVFAVNDKDKYDPEGKSKKVKPGRPGIFVE